MPDLYGPRWRRLQGECDECPISGHPQLDRIGSAACKHREHDSSFEPAACLLQRERAVITSVRGPLELGRCLLATTGARQQL